MGTPMTGVIAFIGIIPIVTGSMLICVQNSDIAAPVSIVTGIRVL